MNHRPKTKQRRKKLPWVRFSDEALLDLRFNELGLILEGSRLEPRVLQLYEELERRGLKFRPHCWLAEEWFSPGQIPGIAIPFYLAHPRLMQLERRQMFEVEGDTDEWCMKILRHEAGHAIDTAFRLHRKRRYHQVFGNPSRPYPEHYRPRTLSKGYVLHLGWWYAQSHPFEDFAETFAVWLQPRARWRKQYSGWPALKKLEFADEVLAGLEGETAPVRSRRRLESLVRNRRTLRQHYEEKRKYYGAEYPELFDRDLSSIFPLPVTGGSRRSAVAFVQAHRAELREIVANGTGEHPYTVDQVIHDVILRCRERRLRLASNPQRALMEISTLLAVQVINHLHTGRQRIAV